MGVDAEHREARGQIVDPLRWRAVIRERDPSLAAPQRVAEGGAQVPGHDAVGRQVASGDLLVVAHDRGQQLHAGAHIRAGEKAQVILRLGSSGRLEIYYQPERAAFPHLVVAMQVTVRQHGRAR